MAGEKKLLIALFSATFLFLFLFLSAISGFSASLSFSSRKPFAPVVRRGPNSPPAFAYYIYGGRGHGDQILRLLLAVYHPRNWYLLHLGSEASDKERHELAAAIRTVPAIHAFENVDVVGKADALTYMGSSILAATLHAAAILTRLDDGWDWFVVLSSLDYPLMTQDDFHVLFSEQLLNVNLQGDPKTVTWDREEKE